MDDRNQNEIKRNDARRDCTPDVNTSVKMTKQKKQNILRLIIQCISFAFHNGYVNGWVKGKIYTGDNKMFCVPGLNCYSCPGAIGSCPIGSLQAVLDQSGFHLSLYVIGFIGAVGVFCGRFVCGWLCPFGLVQDLIYRIPFFKKVKNLPGHKYLRYLRFVILAVFVIILPMGIKNQAGSGQPWFCEYICPSGTLLGGIPLVIANAELSALIGPRFIWKVALLVLILIAALISDRPFCKYICPLGALYGLANPISIYRYRVDKDACIGCGACQKACGADIRVWENPNSMDCIRCGKCMAACPTGALYTSLNKHNAGMVMQADTKIDMSVEANADIQADAQDGKYTLGTGRKIAIIISGLICLSVSIYALYEIYQMMSVVISSQSLSNVLNFLQYMMGLLIMAAPAIMVVILGLGLLACATFKPELYGKMISWPISILKTIGICAIVSLVGYFILAIMMVGGFSTDLFVYAFVLSLSGLAIGGILAIASLIALLIVMTPKSTDSENLSS